LHAQGDDVSLDFSNERYVRVYTRDTTTWKLCDWRARTVLLHLLRKVDRSGVLDVGEDGVAGLAAVLELPLEEIVEPGIAQLVKRGTVEQTAGAYVLPNFLEAQETPATDAQRQRDSRERRRSERRARGVPERFVYVAAASDGTVKIGVASDVRSRLWGLNTGRPDPAVLVACWPGTEADEKEAHQLWAHLRVRGEWFQDDGISGWAKSKAEKSQSHVESHRVTNSVTPNRTVPILAEPSKPDLSRVPRAHDPTVPVAAPVHTPAPKPDGQIGELLEHAIKRLDAARTDIGGKKTMLIGSALHVGVDGELLRAKLRPIDSAQRRGKLDHCLDVLIAKARADGKVDALRLGMLAGDLSWPRWLAETPETYSSPRAPPRGQRAGRALTGLDALVAIVAEEKSR
jgi:hypothetical protein